MESMGEFFRQVRETKGLTLDEVATKTRIRMDFLKALEEENFAALPEQVFVQGFVRSYAKALGLAEDDAIHRFAQASFSYYTKQGEVDWLMRRQAEEERKQSANRKAVMVAMGVALLTLIFLLSREQSSRLVGQSSFDRSAPSAKLTTPLDPQPQVVPPTPAPEVAPPVPQAQMSEPPSVLPKVRAESKVDPVPGPARTTSPAPIPPPIAAVPLSLGSDGPLGGMSFAGVAVEPAGQLVLDLEATEESWVIVKIDNSRPNKPVLLRPSEKRRWTGRDQFVLTLGNAGGIKGELNGKPQNPFGPSGKVVRNVVIKP